MLMSCSLHVYCLTPQAPSPNFKIERVDVSSPLSITPQDANSIYFLLEAVTASEMWSIVYEAASGHAEGELPIEHGRCEV